MGTPRRLLSPVDIVSPGREQAGAMFIRSTKHTAWLRLVKQQVNYSQCCNELVALLAIGRGDVILKEHFDIHLGKLLQVEVVFALAAGKIRGGLHGAAKVENQVALLPLDSLDFRRFDDGSGDSKNLVELQQHLPAQIGQTRPGFLVKRL